MGISRAQRNLYAFTNRTTEQKPVVEENTAADVSDEQQTENPVQISPDEV